MTSINLNESACQCEPVAEIDLGALKTNYRILSARNRKPAIAVIKANAYGHGAVPVARALQSVGCAFFAVARFSEALELRDAGINDPILLLGRLATEDAPRAAQLNVHVNAYDTDQVITYAQALSESVPPLRLHLKVDTGMSRLGVTPQDAPGLIRRIRALPGLALEGIYSHLATADYADRTATDRQIDRFTDLIAKLEAMNLRPPMAHLANSAGSVAHPRACVFDAVRYGLSLYGLDPSGDCPNPPGIRPVMRLRTQVIAVRQIEPGSAVGYGGKYTVGAASEKIAVIATGYADGFRRAAGNTVLVGGYELPVVGTVCMDQCMVRLPDSLNVRVGDEVVLLGEQGTQKISAETIASRWGTINYEVTCGVLPRVRRAYRNG